MYLFILPVIIFTLLRFNVFCFRLFYLCVVVFLILDYDLLLHYVKVTLFYKLSLLLFIILSHLLIEESPEHWEGDVEHQNSQNHLYLLNQTHL